jgi:hypothetical protein
MRTRQEFEAKVGRKKPIGEKRVTTGEFDFFLHFFSFAKDTSLTLRVSVGRMPSGNVSRDRRRTLPEA